MNEEGKNESHVALAGAYRVVQAAEGFRLKPNYSVQGEYPDAKDLVFESYYEAREVSALLSRVFQKGFSEGTSVIKIGDTLEYEVSGGYKGCCKLHILKEGKRDGKPIEPKSPQELVEALLPFFGERE